MEDESLSSNLIKEKEEELKNIIDSEYEKEKENEWFNKVKKKNFENEERKFYETGFGYEPQKIKSAVSSKSKQSTRTNKTLNSKLGIIGDKSNPGYLYLMEIERNKKKRNHTAKMNKKRLILPSTNRNNSPWNNRINNFESEKKLNQINKKQFTKDKNSFLNLWPNILGQPRFKTEIGVKGFINGVPIIDTRKKKDDNFYDNNNNKGKKKIPEIDYQLNNSKEEKKRKGKNNKINDDKKIENENNNVFNTNQKNFFKFRKDIIEEPEYKEEDNSFNELEDHVINLKKKEEENKLKENEEIKKLNNTKEKNGKTSIQFPEIYKYFRKVS